MGRRASFGQMDVQRVRIDTGTIGPGISGAVRQCNVLRASSCLQFQQSLGTRHHAQVPFFVLSAPYLARCRDTGTGLHAKRPGWAPHYEL